MIRGCTCVHKAQDEFYGKGKRVMNKKAKPSPPWKREYTCSVCGKTQGDK